MAVSIPSSLQDNFLTCKICYEVYKEPKVLGCLHSFCLQCLEKHLWKSNKTEYVICPICRESTTVTTEGIRSLKSNFYVKNLIEFLETSAIAYSPRRNQEFPSLQTDVVEESETVKEESPSSRPEYDPNELCPMHARETKRYMCESCSIAVCRLCVLSKHRSHVCIKLTNESTRKREVFESILRTYHSNVSSLRDAISKINMRQKDLLEEERLCLDDIRKAEEDLTKRIHTESLQTSETMKGGFQVIRSKLNEQRDSVSNDVETLETLMKKCQNMIQDPKCDFDNAYATLKEKLEAVQSCLSKLQTDVSLRQTFSVHISKQFSEPFPLNLFRVEEGESQSNEQPNEEKPEVIPDVPPNSPPPLNEQLVAEEPENIADIPTEYPKTPEGPPKVHKTETISRLPPESPKAIVEQPNECKREPTTDLPPKGHNVRIETDRVKIQRPFSVDRNVIPKECDMGPLSPRLKSEKKVLISLRRANSFDCLRKRYSYYETDKDNTSSLNAVEDKCIRFVQRFMCVDPSDKKSAKLSCVSWYDTDTLVVVDDHNDKLKFISLRDCSYMQTAPILNAVSIALSGSQVVCSLRNGSIKFINTNGAPREAKLPVSRDDLRPVVTLYNKSQVVVVCADRLLVLHDTFVEEKRMHAENEWIRTKPMYAAEYKDTNILLSDWLAHRVLYLTESGKAYRDFKMASIPSTEGLFRTPGDLCSDVNGNVFVVEYWKSVLVQLDQDGKYVRTMNLRPYARFPKNIALSSEGKLLVSCQDGLVLFEIRI